MSLAWEKIRPKLNKLFTHPFKILRFGVKYSQRFSYFKNEYLSRFCLRFCRKAFTCLAVNLSGRRVLKTLFKKKFTHLSSQVEIRWTISSEGLSHVE